MKHRQDDVVNERRMKEPEYGAGGERQGEKSPAPAVPQTGTASPPAAFGENTEGLQKEVGGGQSESAARRERDDGFVNQA